MKKPILFSLLLLLSGSVYLGMKALPSGGAFSPATSGSKSSIEGRAKVQKAKAIAASLEEEIAAIDKQLEENQKSLEAIDEKVAKEKRLVERLHQLDSSYQNQKLDSEEYLAARTEIEKEMLGE